MAMSLDSVGVNAMAFRASSRVLASNAPPPSAMTMLGVNKPALTAKPAALAAKVPCKKVLRFILPLSRNFA
jgi:hypothetical protein